MLFSEETAVSKCFVALFPATDIKKEKLIVNMVFDPRVTEYRRKALAACYLFDQIEKLPSGVASQPEGR